MEYGSFNLKIKCKERLKKIKAVYVEYSHCKVPLMWKMCYLNKYSAYKFIE